MREVTSTSTSSTESNLLEIGRVVKPHGLKGDVVVELVTNRAERLEPGTQFTVSDLSLTIKKAIPHQHRWIVTFEEVNGIEKANQLRGAVLEAEPLDDPDALWIHELIGAEVFDTSGVSHGCVVEVEANPASDLLVLESGSLVPLNFVAEHGDGRVVIDPPEGLFDLDAD